MRKLLAVAVMAVFVVGGGIVRADEPPLKIGVVMTYSGPFASYGHQTDSGLLHG